jgi:hypothetical protein
LIDDSGSGKVGDLTDRKHSLYRKIADWIHPQVPKEVFREIIKSNVCNLQWIAAAVSILEMFILVLYTIRQADHLADELDSLFSVLFCIVLSIAVAVHLSKVTRSEELLEQKLYRERGVLIAYYTVLMIWGMPAQYPQLFCTWGPALAGYDPALSYPCTSDRTETGCRAFEPAAE